MADGNLMVGDFVFRTEPISKRRFPGLAKIMSIEDFIDPDGITRKNVVARLSDGGWEFIWHLISLQDVQKGMV